MRRAVSIPAIGVAMVVLTVGAVPLMAQAADHLDAPNLGSIHVDASDNLAVTKTNGPLDINDVYVFKEPHRPGHDGQPGCQSRDRPEHVRCGR